MRYANDAMKEEYSQTLLEEGRIILLSLVGNHGWIQSPLEDIS
jgi:hypothetical protein